MADLGGYDSGSELSSEDLLVSLGFPRDLARARAASDRLAPRHPDTARVFESVVREIFVPELKRAGFKKTRNVWTRRRELIRAVVDIQRGSSSGDLLEFTSNWHVRIDGFAVGRRRDDVVSGRIGNFLDAGEDHWWSIQLGWLARHTPTVIVEPDDCRRELAEGLHRTIAWLDDVDTLPKLIAALEPDDLPTHFRGAARLFPIERKRDVMSALRLMDGTAAAP
jgi:Domain of unknown function (DUF4304)